MAGPPDGNELTTFTTEQRTAGLAQIPIGGATIVARNIYRTAMDGAQLKFVKTINDNTTTFTTDGLADASLGVNAPTSATNGQVPLTNIPIGGALVTARKIYRRFNGAGTFKLVTTISDNSTTTYTDTTSNASLGADAPSSNTATANQVSLTGIPIGGAAVAARKLYRTVAAGSQLKLLTTISDNTTTTYTDSTADASLGANVPVSDTSGLAQPEGQVIAGAAALIVAGTGAFSASGGWAIIGNGQQVVRYTGVDASGLTGIPASGIGAITASVSYNSSITAAPELHGIPASGAGSILYPILRGDSVNIYVTRNDATAQAALVTLIGAGFDGIREDFIQDRRLSQDEIEARCDALLEARKDARAQVTYQTQDVHTVAGATITVNIGPPTNVTGTFKIQQVTIAQFIDKPNMTSAHLPWRTVLASNEKFSLEDILRQRRERLT
jgi:hypothetical protein